MKWIHFFWKNKWELFRRRKTSIINIFQYIRDFIILYLSKTTLFYLVSILFLNIKWIYFLKSTVERISFKEFIFLVFLNLLDNHIFNTTFNSITLRIRLLIITKLILDISNTIILRRSGLKTNKTSLSNGRTPQLHCGSIGSIPVGVNKHPIKKFIPK